jgi:hypothetical protein
MAQEMIDQPQSSDVPMTGDLQCVRCGATLPAEATNCWLCYAPVATQRHEREGTQAARPRPTRIASTTESSSGFSLASLMMFVTLLCVVLGVSTIAPGIGIPLGIVFIVVWLRTVAVARHRQQSGLEVTRSEKLQLFLGSFGAALALIAVTCVAGCAAFVAACFACAATMNVGGDAAGMMVFAGVAAAIVIPTLWLVAKVIRRRWRRDIGEGG